MSKAFTRESDDLVLAELPPRPPFDAANRPITRDGADRLRRRLNHLLEQPPLHPDEPGRRRRLDLEIHQLQSRLDTAIVAAPSPDPTKVAFGAFVQMRNEDGEEESYQIVGVDEVNPEEGRISAISPLGRALLSRREGNQVRFQTPGGVRQFTILKVHY